MARNPTMKDVATAAGVSVMTVSRAFKRHSSVSEETRARILSTAESMGYVFDSMAANLRSQRSGFVAVTIPSLNNANFADTVRGLSDGLQEAGLEVLLGYSNYDILEEERLIEQLLRRRPEAIVVTGGRHTGKARLLLQNSGVPVIETWDLPSNPIDHVVGFSNSATMEVMIEHLVERGLERIAFIGGDTDGDTRGADRRRGFVKALEDRGMDPSRLIGAGRPPISMREGADAMGRLLDEYPDTRAVICVSDLSAFGALTECQRCGVRVPEDIAIAGFGAFEISAICVPTITTIDPHAAEIGRRTAELIRRVLSGEQNESDPIRVRIEPQISIRQSTG